MKCDKCRFNNLGKFNLINWLYQCILIQCDDQCQWGLFLPEFMNYTSFGFKRNIEIIFMMVKFSIWGSLMMN